MTSRINNLAVAATAFAIFAQANAQSCTVSDAANKVLDDFARLKTDVDSIDSQVAAFTTDKEVAGVIGIQDGITPI